MRAPITPLRVACLMGGLGQGGQGTTVVALELANARELPSISLDIARVPDERGRSRRERVRVG
jgi:hypothetical protein